MVGAMIDLSENTTSLLSFIVAAYAFSVSFSFIAYRSSSVVRIPINQLFRRGFINGIKSNALFNRSLGIPKHSEIQI